MISGLLFWLKIYALRATEPLGKLMVYRHLWYPTPPVRKVMNGAGYSGQYCSFFYPPGYTSTASWPMFICIHGGGFIGGYPEMDAEFCRKLAKVETMCNFNRLTAQRKRVV
jgi:acetyl esterase/lipase